MTEPRDDDLLNLLNLPEPAALPPAVHARLRQRVFTQLGESDHRRVGRVPVAVAAVVVLLAAGVTLLAQSVHGEHTLLGPAAAKTTSPAAQPFDPAVAQRDLNRCWSAIVAAHRTSGVPARSTWQVVFGRHNDPDVDVVAVSAGGKRFFCETTLTSVTVSSPNPVYAAGSRTGSLLITPSGTVAGVVDPSWHSMLVTSASPSGSSQVEPADIDHGMFTEFSVFPTGQGARFAVRELDPGEPDYPPVPVGGKSTAPKPGQPGTGESHVALTLPRPAAPLVSVQDRPAAPVDRSSANGKLLAQCIAKTDTIVPDPQTWQPGALATQKGNQTVLMTRNATSYAVCARLPGPDGQVFSFVVAPGGSQAADQPVNDINYTNMALPSSVSDSSQTLVIGVVSKDVKRVQLLSPTAAPAETTPVNGTFVFFAKLASPLTLRFLDDNGKLIRKGTVS